MSITAKPTVLRPRTPQIKLMHCYEPAECDSSSAHIDYMLYTALGCSVWVLSGSVMSVRVSLTLSLETQLVALPFRDDWATVEAKPVCCQRSPLG
jgi:hypothetical protein